MFFPAYIYHKHIFKTSVYTEFVLRHRPLFNMRWSQVSDSYSPVLRCTVFPHSSVNLELHQKQYLFRKLWAPSGENLEILRRMQWNASHRSLVSPQKIISLSHTKMIKSQLHFWLCSIQGSSHCSKRQVSFPTLGCVSSGLPLHSSS
jgi:hypothetical protein